MNLTPFSLADDYEPMTDDDYDSQEMEDELPSIEFINEKITDAQAESRIKVIDSHFEKMCSWLYEVIQILEQFLNKGKKIWIIDGLNETCRARTQMKTLEGFQHGPYECHQKGCPCKFEDIICAQSLKYSNDILLVVTKDPNYKISANWHKNMLDLSNLPNVIMFPMTMDSMEITSDEFKNKYYYHSFLDGQKKKKQRDHDDLGVLLLARIIEGRYGLGRFAVVSQDHYRDKEIVANVSPPYTFNIVKGGNVLFNKKVDPRIINSFIPCKCDNWACSQKNSGSVLAY